MADYTQWPIAADISARLASAGVTPRLTGAALTDRIQQAADAVTGDVAKKTSRQFIADTVDTTRIYDGTGTPEMEVDEMVSLTSVNVQAFSFATTFALMNASLIVEQNLPMTRLVVAKGSYPAITSEGIMSPIPAIFLAGRQNIQVTGIFGYAATVPTDLWDAVCGEIAFRLAQEAIFKQEGRLTEWAEGNEKEKYALDTDAITQWRDTYTKTRDSYKRPSGRRLRNLRPPPI